MLQDHCECHLPPPLQAIVNLVDYTIHEIPGNDRVKTTVNILGVAPAVCHDRPQEKPVTTVAVLVGVCAVQGILPMV
jgi:hypothetical protein